MTDTTELDRTLGKIKKIGGIVAGSLYILALVGVFGGGLSGLAWVGIFLGIIALFVITLFWWFGGMLHYKTAKSVLAEQPRRYYDWTQARENAEYNIELFSRYIKVYTILWDAVRFQLKHYKGFL
jgi:hypothetical protein